MKKEHNHLVKGIPNTEKNRAKVKELNKLARKSNSQHRLKIKYRKPTNGYLRRDGSVPKKDAQCFSLYLDTTETQKKLVAESCRKQYEFSNTWKLKYEALQNKYNAMMLKPLLQGLLDNVEEMQYATEQGEHWGNIVNSLKGITQGITEDINNKLEV